MSTNAELAEAFEATAAKLIEEVTAPPSPPATLPQAVKYALERTHPSKDPNQVEKAYAKAETLRMIADVYRGLK